MKCDLESLRLLKQPASVYDVITKLDYPHSSAHRLLKEYAEMGIIEVVERKKLASGLTKTLYKLNELGLELLYLLERLSENCKFKCKRTKLKPRVFRLNL